MPDVTEDRQPGAAPAPPAPQSPPADSSTALKAEDLIGAGMVEVAQRRTLPTDQDAAPPRTPAPRGVEADEDELDDEELDLDEDDYEEDEADEADSDPEVAAEVDRFADMLLRQPQRIDEVPRQHRREAIIRSQRAAFEMGRQQGQAAAQQAGTATRQSDDAEFAALVDRQREDDPDGFIEWSVANPRGAARYYAIKAGEPRRPDVPPRAEQQLTPDQQRRATQATNALKRLEGNSEALARLQAKANANAYPPTDEGLEALLLDIGEELSRSKAATEGERTEATRRRAAGARRRGVARPDIQGTRRSSDAESVTDGPLNVRELLAQGIKDTQVRARNGQTRTAGRA